MNTSDFALFRTLGLLKVFKLPIYISYLTVLFYTQNVRSVINYSLLTTVAFCSCTTCIVYVNSSKIASFLNCFSFQKADAKVRTFKYIFQIISEVFFFFLFLVVSLCEREIKEERERSS